MSFNEKPVSSLERRPEKVRTFVQSPEAAASLVMDFWKAMSHGGDLVRAVELDAQPDWLQELTYGDRTLARRANSLEKREGKGEWVVLFMGNNQALSSEAVAWLKEKGLVG